MGGPSAGPVVAGPVVPDLLAATRSAQAAAAGLKACSAWQDAPRPVLADDLLPERAIAGDPSAREQLVEEIYRPLEEAGSALLETLSVYLEQASSLEGAARMLFVHPNTVRQHVSTLEADGFVARDRRTTGGKGRPRAVYRVTSLGERSGERNYELLARVLIERLASSGESPAPQARAAGRSWGAHLGGAVADGLVDPGVHLGD